MSEPHLRQVLGAAAAGAGLHLRDVGLPGVLSDAQAREAAAAWGLLTEGSGGAPTVVVLVDGLGLELLRERLGHAPTLRSWLSASSMGPAARAGSGPGPVARTCTPSTTAAALTSLGTGALPGVTGMVGYSVLNPLLDRTLLVDTAPHPEQNLCLITWEGRAPDPRAWQDVPTIFERLERDPDRPRPHGEPGAPLAVTIGPARFAGSGLTVAGLRGAPHLGADCLEVRPGLAVEALRRGIPLVYLYVGELDRTGHAHGWRSVQWLEQLERLDAAMAGLVRRVPAGTRIILTADHGMVDTGPDRRVDISASPALARDVVAVAGEPRFTHLYVPGSDQDVASEVARRWRDELGERAMWIGTRAEAGRHLGPVGQRAAGVLGDVLVAMSQEWVAVDPRVHSESAIAMPGVHGSLTWAETAIPLLTTLT